MGVGEKIKLTRLGRVDCHRLVDQPSIHPIRPGLTYSNNGSLVLSSFAAMLVKWLLLKKKISLHNEAAKFLHSSTS